MKYGNLDQIEKQLNDELQSKYGLSPTVPQSKPSKRLIDGLSDSDSDLSDKLPTKNVKGSYDKQQMINELCQSSDDSSDSDRSPQKKPSKLNTNYKSNQKNQKEFDKLFNERSANQMQYNKEYDDGQIDLNKKAMKNSILNDLDLDDLGMQTDSIVEPKDMPNQYENLNILQIIEKNEKINEAVPDQLIQQANQLLSFDNKFYNSKNKLMVFEDYPVISRKLHQQDHKFYGQVQCVHMLKNFIFVGNSQGIIRVFDIKSQKEMKPLMDLASVKQEKVTCIDIDSNAGLLLSGYKNGSVALWDLLEYKLLKYIPSLHDTEVSVVKIYEVLNNGGSIKAVTSEDQGGVRHLEINKKAIFGGYNHTSEYLFKSKLKGTTAIAVYESSSQYPNQFCDDSQLVAVGGSNMITICTMKPIDCIYTIQKPTFCKDKSLPYVDWGFGLTPSHREKTVPMMAFAWDRVIQLIYINDEGTSLEIDGFYYSDKEIISLSFLADSVIFAVFEGIDSREAKILYTTKFYPGTYKSLEDMARYVDRDSQYDKVIQVTLHAELEKSHEILEMKSQLVHSCMINNFSNSVQKYKQNILFLGLKSLQRGRIFSWKEYLEHMQFKENNNWLSILKLALEIYDGDLKGYANVADEKEVREQNLKGYMEDLVKSTIESVILKFKKREVVKIEKDNFSTNSGSGSSKEGDFQTDAIAIKVAIEFCLNIGSIDFLFNQMLLLFEHNNLRSKFIQNLEPFIISGQFRKELIPKEILEQILNQYEGTGDSVHQLKNLERIVQQLDLKKYDDLMRARLEIICEKNCMVSALLALQSSQDIKAQESSILMTMFNLMKKVGLKEQNKKSQAYSYKDIQDLLIVDSKIKYQIEKSKCYIGYKLLWIMKMYLEGRSFPYGSLQHEKFEQYSIQISKLVMNNQFIKEFLEFDSKCFFESIQKLFYGQPFNFVAYLDPQPITIIINLSNIVQDMNNYRHQKSQSADKDPEDSLLMSHFYSFILNVEVHHQRWQIAQTMKGKHVKGQKVLKLEFNLVMQSIYSILKIWTQEQKDTQNIKQFDQSLVIDAIKSQDAFDENENQKLLKCIDELNISEHMINLRIFLLEHSNNFLQSFKLHMLDQDLKMTVFDWIENKFAILNGSIDQNKYIELKNIVAGQMREIIQIDVDKTIKLIEKWYEDSFVDQLILEELFQYPEVQLDFLRKFIHFNEEIIRLVIKDTAGDIGKKPQLDKYMKYLCLFVELMCQLSNENKASMTPQVIEAYVKIEYYPIAECLEICQKYNQKRAIAALLERSNDYIGAIDTYMQHIKGMSLVLIGTELAQIVRDCQQREWKRKKMTDDTQPSSEELIHFYGHNWDYEECYKYKYLTDFDQSLQKACDLAKRVYESTPHIPKSSRRNPNDDEDGEKAWFRVLIVLDEWQKTVSASLMNEAYKNSESLAELQKTSIGRHLPTVGGLLSDFLTRRINSIIMRQVPIQIDPETLIDRLTLSLNSIRQIFEFKVKVIKNEKKIIKIASRFMMDEVKRDADINRQKAAIGYLMESDPQIQKQKNVQQLQKDICDYCNHDLVNAFQKCPIRVYLGCAHTFHSHCVTQIINEQNQHAKKNKAESAYSKSQCIKCTQVEGNINMQDIRDACKYNQKGISQRMSMRRSNLDEPDSPEQVREADYEIETAKGLKEENDTLFMHKLEDFDNMVCQSQIFLNDFGKV